jgi:histidyl-tRNA synthetase
MDGISTLVSFGDRSVKAQMKAANSSGATYAIIIGEDEVHAGTATLRNLETGEQITLRQSDVASAVRSNL